MKRIKCEECREQIKSATLSHLLGETEMRRSFLYITIEAEKKKAYKQGYEDALLKHKKESK